MTTDAPLRLEWLMPDSLDPNPLNWRKHPPQQTNAMDALLFGEDGVGWAGVLLYNEETGRLIDGHLRQELALKRNDPVPVLIGSWTEAQEKRILATFDPIAGMAQTDKEALDALLRDVEASDSDVMAMLSDLAEREGVVTVDEPIPPDEFREYDEDIETQYQCPKCGYEWSGGAS